MDICDSRSDLEQVRLALGYGRLNIFAGSYGTRAAAVYLRAYPASVRTAYLGSVVPIDVAQPLPMARAEEDALDKMVVGLALRIWRATKLFRH